MLNAAMGWLDSHLHQFDVGDRKYSIADDDVWIDADPPLPEESVTLADLVHDGVKRFGYWYDFGDSWHHDVIIEQTGSAAEGVFYPRCIAGRRACPPEDCGGLWGFAAFSTEKVSKRLRQVAGGAR